MVESIKGHNLDKISRNSLKDYSSHRIIDPKSNAKYQNPSLSGSQDIVLTNFFLLPYWQSNRGHYLVNISRNALKN